MGSVSNLRRRVGCALPTRAEIALFSVLALCAFGFAAAWLASPYAKHRAMAADILERLKNATKPSDCDRDSNERKAELRRLADAPTAVVVEFLRQLPLQRIEDEVQLCPEEGSYLVNAALGFDRDGSRTRAIARAHLLPALRTRSPLPSFLPDAMLRSERLHLDPTTAKLLYEAGLSRIEEGRGLEPFTSRSRPSIHAALAQVGQQLDAKDALTFVPRLVELVRNRDLAAGGNLAALAPLLGPDELFSITRVLVRAGIGYRGQGASDIASLSERLSPAQVETLLPEVLETIKQHPLAWSPSQEQTQTFLGWADAVGALAARMGPVQRNRMGRVAVEAFRSEMSDLKAVALAVVFLPLLDALDRSDLASVLRPIIRRLPDQDVFLHFYIKGKTLRLLGMADPADVSSAARQMLKRLIEGGKTGRVEANLADALGGWAPALTTLDALTIAQALAGEMVQAQASHVVTALSRPLDSLSTQLRSGQALAVAQILVRDFSLQKVLDDRPNPPPGARSYDASLPDWLRARLGCLAARLEEADQRALVRDLRARILHERHAPTADWLREVLQSVTHPAAAPSTTSGPAAAIYTRQVAELVAETLNGQLRPAPGEEVSPYVDAIVRALPKIRQPAKRCLLIREIVRATSAWPSTLALSTYKRAIPAQQLYVDLLKEPWVFAEEWQVLVGALQATSGLPTGGNLWSYLAWSEQNAAGRSLGLDWQSAPPWW